MDIDNCDVFVILANGRKWEERQNCDQCYLLKFVEFFLREWIQEVQIFLRISQQK